MKKYLFTSIGRLRILAFLEGFSLLALVFIAVPLKHIFDSPQAVKAIGPIHGAMFLLFIFTSLRVGIEQNWKFKQTTWKVILACFIPFGTFYIEIKFSESFMEIIRSPENIYVFKTNVQSSGEIWKLAPLLNHMVGNGNWNFALDDCDKILRVRVVSETVTAKKVIALLKNNGFFCEELA